MALKFQFPGLPNVRCLFTGRQDGNISYKCGESRKVMRNRSGLPPFAECRQAHGNRLLFDPAPADPAHELDLLPEADGMAARGRGPALMIKTADCQPVLFAHRDGGHIMALHVGWRGNRMGFIQDAVSRFCGHYGLAPQDLMAVRGPSLGPASAEFVNFDSEWGPEFAAWRDPDTGCMDLWELTRAQLMQAGLKRIYGVDICTALNDDEWFSYRRSKNAGRQASLIWIE